MEEREKLKALMKNEEIKNCENPVDRVRPQKPMASTECHLDPCQALHLSISIRHGSK